MNWEAIGAMAEFLGAVAIIISLVYLAVQIRQNTRSVRAATELETSRMWSEFHARVAHSPDMARIWDKGHKAGSVLSDGEKQRFIWLISEYVFLVEGLYRQYTAGFLSSDSWTPHESTVAGLMENDTLREWWQSGVSPFSKGFRKHMESVVANTDQRIWKYTPLSEL